MCIFSGTDEERGLHVWRHHVTTTPTGDVHALSRDHVTYDVPYISGLLRRYRWLRHLPFLQNVTV